MRRKFFAIFFAAILCVASLAATFFLTQSYSENPIIAKSAKAEETVTEEQTTEAVTEEPTTEATTKSVNNNYVAGTSYAKAVPDMPIYDEETDKFFENSVFYGDSLTVGFGRYCEALGEGFFCNPLFLASTSFSLKQAIGPVTDTTLHPTYGGEKLSPEDTIVKTGAEKVFLFLGMNDLVWTDPTTTLDEYNTLIFRIHNKSPEAKIYIIGATYIYAPGQRFENGDTNANLRIFNDALYSYCENYDYLEFINIGDRLIDSTDGLKSEYTSDNYVHMTAEGYDVWIKVLRSYAKYFTAVEAAEASQL
ncbi:MAG: SGNH/GDSL hydrolase family protein [Clostridiales bacterium]|nr:SGNH/GDSL hydrolase family protein [Clostridiales bacterium]